MSYGDPEIAAVTSCPGCGCREVFRAVARPGERERPVFLRCCRCGRERDEIDFYEEAGQGIRKEPVRVDWTLTGSITLHGHRDSSLYRSADPNPKIILPQIPPESVRGRASRMARSDSGAPSLRSFGKIGAGPIIGEQGLGLIGREQGAEDIGEQRAMTRRDVFLEQPGLRIEAPLLETGREWLWSGRALKSNR